LEFVEKDNAYKLRADAVDAATLAGLLAEAYLKGLKNDGKYFFVPRSLQGYADEYYDDDTSFKDYTEYLAHLESFSMQEIYDSIMYFKDINTFELTYGARNAQQNIEINFFILMELISNYRMTIIMPK
jgi:hypothetical protein